MPTLNLAGFEQYRRFFTPSYGYAFAGISGGRTSAVMAALLDDSVQLLFENTGREHPGTYDFLRELDRALGGRLIWLEYVKPKTKGAAPKEATFRRVSYETADRSGGPFQSFMETLTEYRAIQKDLPPTAPWPGARLCTAQMKHKTGERYIASLGVNTYTMYVGLRADEPERVLSLKKQETQARDFMCPLADAGLTKADVLRFWQQQNFDLRIAEYQGNCDGCFLKDQADLSRALGEMPDPEFWFFMETAYPRFGGVTFAGYKQLHNEYRTRLAVESCLREALARGLDKKQAEYVVKPLFKPDIFKTERRFLNVIRQEYRRCVEGAKAVSCSCESSFDSSDLS